jgi:pimeloyl-ACP methyl ester carboxylesterase
MATVTSQDGAKIGFDKVGFGPAVILVNGAMSFRAMDPTLAQLAELLGAHFTVYNYDRRGRGESGDTKPFAKEREIEDIKALVKDAGGQAMLFGISSGGAVALEAAAALSGVPNVVVYEVPFIVDDSRPPLKDYKGYTSRLVADGKLDELVEYFSTAVAGMPAEFVGGMKQDQALWGGMMAIAPTIPYDAAFVGKFMEGKPLPSDHWAKVTMPVLVADALAKVLPNASRQTLAGQTHMVDPNALSPVMIEFLK